MNQILNIKSAEKRLKHIFLNCSSHEPFLHKLIEDTHRISQASKVILKILQARLPQYVNQELPDVQAGFRKGRRTKDQIANIHWIIEKARGFQKNIYCFIDYAKAFDHGSQQSVENS